MRYERMKAALLALIMSASVIPFVPSSATAFAASVWM